MADYATTLIGHGDHTNEIFELANEISRGGYLAELSVSYDPKLDITVLRVYNGYWFAHLRKFQDKLGLRIQSFKALDHLEKEKTA